MAELNFDIRANWEEVVRLREECKRLEEQILETAKATGSLEGTEELQKRLTEATGKLNEFVDSAAEAGEKVKKEVNDELKASTKSMEAFSSVVSAVRESMSDFIKDQVSSGNMSEEQADKLRSRDGRRSADGFPR